MPLPLSLDLRTRIVAARKKGGLTYNDIAEQLQVGPATVSRMLSRDRKGESLEPRPARGGPPPLIGDEQWAWIEAILRDTPDLTMQEVAWELEERHHFKVSRSTVQKEAQKRAWTRKKSPSGRRRLIPSESGSSGSSSRSVRKS